MSEMPFRSFGFRGDDREPAPAGRPPRVLRDVRLLYLSLDLWPGPYGSVPRQVTRDDGEEGP